MLDWAVAKCEGKGIEFDDPTDPWLTLDGIAYQPLHSYTPSTDWAQGGPIIEREMITVGPAKHQGFMAWGWPKKEGSWGDSPLQAAMRCYVASKLGYEIEIPEGI
jgi:hypothetical protein